ncbi:hypothetical protein BDQ17DRAFT_1041074 [Cyathus striatus]|nr:hypothetical protein BDQ17DRAFT_1041074 [Cyathus striatus]
MLQMFFLMLQSLAIRAAWFLWFVVPSRWQEFVGLLTGYTIIYDALLLALSFVLAICKHYLQKGPKFRLSFFHHIG